MSKKILITGASGGFGKLITLTLLKNGYQVVASMRDTEGRNKDVADELHNAGAKIVSIDVTNEASVTTGLTQAIKELDGLDVLINNAGVGVIGLQECYTAQDFQKIFDINVFGVQRMNRAVLPHFRENKKGLIIYISSLLGRVYIPFYGPYQATKWALEALASNYRVEQSAFGIENCIVEPGGYPTTFNENLMRPSDQERLISFGDFANAPERAQQNFEKLLENNAQQNPQKVADIITELIAKPLGEKPFRTTVDFIGMGELVHKYNEHLEQLTTGLYTNFGTQDLLNVKNHD
jgi:NADP-dependent 3-hydroxy acid dehydrogenase YdfG